ncbi:hypothetical protein ACFYY8_27785 [Streptosporangium sp. NPDC001559]|uniref:hypothetical protein n=1 Tax=Streptosporangium sp. NPDC001559 TaxID=3366187 RepID=UPI0036E9CA3D
MRHSLRSVADEIGVSERDLLIVAEADLGGLFDPSEETVSDEGRRLLVAHFLGGTDPEPRR